MAKNVMNEYTKENNYVLTYLNFVQKKIFHIKIMIFIN